MIVVRESTGLPAPPVTTVRNCTSASSICGGCSFAAAARFPPSIPQSRIRIRQNLAISFAGQRFRLPPDFAEATRTGRLRAARFAGPTWPTLRHIIVHAGSRGTLPSRRAANRPARNSLAAAPTAPARIFAFLAFKSPHGGFRVAIPGTCGDCAARPSSSDFCPPCYSMKRTLRPHPGATEPGRTPFGK